MPKTTNTTTAQKKNHYAVVVGRRTGVFASWDDAERSVSNFPGAKKKSFQTYGEASKLAQQEGSNASNLGGGSGIDAGGGKFYAVGVGRNVGVYQSWDECKAEVQGLEGAKYKGFWSREEAEEWVLEKIEEREKRRGSKSKIPAVAGKKKTSSGSSSSLGQQRVEGSAASSFNRPHPGQRSTVTDILLRSMKDLSLFGTTKTNDGYA